MSDRGTLVLVVGPSGAGKDSIIDAARTALRGDDRVVFARRVVTGGADREPHLPASAAEFAALRAAGRFALNWEAHGNAYGIEREALAALAAGRCVVANVSRTVVAEARRRYAPVVVVMVTAPEEVLAARLARRGREDAAAVEARLCRSVRFGDDGAVVIDNSGALETAGAAFVALLRRIADGHATS